MKFQTAFTLLFLLVVGGCATTRPVRESRLKVTSTDVTKMPVVVRTVSEPVADFVDIPQADRDPLTEAIHHMWTRVPRDAYVRGFISAMDPGTELGRWVMQNPQLVNDAYDMQIVATALTYVMHGIIVASVPEADLFRTLRLNQKVADQHLLERWDEFQRSELVQTNSL